MSRIYSTSVTILTLLICSCGQSTKQASPHLVTNYESEKTAIIEALLNETTAAFARDYEAWQTNWVHRATITKTYMNFSDTTFSEMISWSEINDFVHDYMEEHPEPVPPPTQPENVSVQVYGTGAWVSYEIMDEVLGRKRETRLMEKENGRWKIAGMHTTIYGFN